MIIQDFLQYVIYIAIGLTIGSVSGILGIGGGVLIVPALIWMCGLDPKKAAGTSLAILIPPIGLPAARCADNEEQVELSAALWIAGAFTDRRLRQPRSDRARSRGLVSAGVRSDHDLRGDALHPRFRFGAAHRCRGHRRRGPGVAGLCRVEAGGPTLPAAAEPGRAACSRSMTRTRAGRTITYDSESRKDEKRKHETMVALTFRGFCFCPFVIDSRGAARTR